MIARGRKRAFLGLGSFTLVLAGWFCAAVVLHLADLVAQGPQPPVLLPIQSAGPQQPNSGEPGGGSNPAIRPDDWEAQLLRDLGIDADGSKESRPESKPADAKAPQRPPSEAEAVVDLMRSVAGSLRTGSLAPDTLEQQRSILQWLDQWFPSTDTPSSTNTAASDGSAGSESPSGEKRPPESGSTGGEGAQESDSGSPSQAASDGKEGQEGSKERSGAAGGESQELPTDRGQGNGDQADQSGGKTPPPRQDGGGRSAEGPQVAEEVGDSPDGQPPGETGDPSSSKMEPSAGNRSEGSSAANEELSGQGQGGEQPNSDPGGASGGVSNGPQSRPSDEAQSQSQDPTARSSNGRGDAVAGGTGEGDSKELPGRLATGPSGGGGFQGKLGDPSEGPAGVDQAAWNDPSRLRRGVWGHLPQQVHQQMLAAPSTEFLPSHRKAIEAYYRRLSEAKR
jgi:hypothetical protein